MKIAVIGSGIIGYMASSYLSRKGHEVICIAPELKKVRGIVPSIGKNNLKYDKPVSPKFQRNDFKENKITSDYLFKKTSKNFIGIELINDIGLARYWGANLALGGLSDDLQGLRLDKKEIEFIEEKIPVLDVLNFYKEIYGKNIQIPKTVLQGKDLKYDLKSSTLAIWKEKCNINCLPDERKNAAIFGSNFSNPKIYTRLNGLVEKITLRGENDKPILQINDFKSTYKSDFDYVIVACGAIGSYRIITNSFMEGKKDLYSRILHHPILCSVCFVPSIRCPKNYISMSNFDLLLKTEHGELYLNFFPLKGAIKAIIRGKLTKNFNDTLKGIVKTFIRIYNKLPDLPVFPNWWTNRLYVTNIYLPSNLTASFISNKTNEIDIIGGMRFDFEKTILRNLWPRIVIKLILKKIFMLPIKPRMVSTGGDMHYSSTLSKYTDIDGSIKYRNFKSNRLLVIDSSSSTYLPTPNPTYYFVARAIKLLRKVKI